MIRRHIAAVNIWRISCIVLHAFLVVIHIVLLGIGAGGHPEHQIIVQENRATLVTSILGAVTQTFATVNLPHPQASSSITLLHSTECFVLNSRLTRPS